jgi:hypothetical protein
MLIINNLNYKYMKTITATSFLLILLAFSSCEKKVNCTLCGGDGKVGVYEDNCRACHGSGKISKSKAEEKWNGKRYN